MVGKKWNLKQNFLWHNFNGKLKKKELILKKSRTLISHWVKIEIRYLTTRKKIKKIETKKQSMHSACFMLQFFDLKSCIHIYIYVYIFTIYVKGTQNADANWYCTLFIFANSLIKIDQMTLK